jgi:hypothetical protein
MWGQMAGSKSKLSLFIDKVQDVFARENFLKINDMLSKEPMLAGNWKFFEVRPTVECQFEPLKVPHNLSYIPKDFIMLSQRIGISGFIKLWPDEFGYFYPYADSKYIYLWVQGPRLKFGYPGEDHTATFDTLTGFPITVALPFFPGEGYDVPFMKEGDPIYFTPGPNSIGAFPPPELMTSTVYYVKYDPTANGGPFYFQLSTTPGGASILSTAGTPASIPSGQTLLCKPTEFKSSVRFLAGAINDL